jgi:hypothetical protein
MWYLCGDLVLQMFNHFVIQLSFDCDIFVPAKTSSMLVFWVNFLCLQSNIFVTYFGWNSTWNCDVFVMFCCEFQHFCHWGTHLCCCLTCLKWRWSSRLVTIMNYEFGLCNLGYVQFVTVSIHFSKILKNEQLFGND